MRGPARGRTLLGFAAVAVVIVAVPGLVSAYSLSLVCTALIYAILAVSLDLSWGYAGILSLGHAVFFGVGAYAVGWLSTDVSETTGLVSETDASLTHLVLGAVLGVLVSALLATVVAWLAFFRSTSSPLYVAVVTLALSIVSVATVGRIDALGGDTGLFGFALDPDRILPWYFVAAGALTVTLAAAHRLVTSDLGSVVRAVRDNEERCRYLGYDVRVVKTAVFVGSAALASFAGSLYGGFQGIASPPLLGFLFATQIVVWVAVGGRGTLVGPVVGAVVINVLGPRLSRAVPVRLDHRAGRAVRGGRRGRARRHLPGCTISARPGSPSAGRRQGPGHARRPGRCADHTVAARLR